MNIFQKTFQKIIKGVKNIKGTKGTKGVANITGLSSLGLMKGHVQYTKISFDASVMFNGDLGIGIYDITNKIKKCTGGNIGEQCSYKAEQMALKYVLEYAHEAGFKNIALFTDNIDLIRKDVIKKYIKEYNFEEVHFTWIPRELNTEADKQAKKGQEQNRTNGTNGISGISGINGRPANQSTLENTEKRSLKIFEKYSTAQKIRMLKNLSTKGSEQEFIRMLETQTKDNYKFNVSKLNVKFIRMAKTLLINDENISPYVKKRLKSMRDPQSKQILKTLTFQEFEAEFNNRKTKWLKKLKWLKKAEKIENPEKIKTA